MSTWAYITWTCTLELGPTPRTWTDVQELDRGPGLRIWTWTFRSWTYRTWDLGPRTWTKDPRPGTWSWDLGPGIWTYRTWILMRSFIAFWGVKKGSKMILNHMPPPCLNMNSYRTIKTHFKPNLIFWGAKNARSWPQTRFLFFLSCRSSHPAILIPLWPPYGW